MAPHAGAGQVPSERCDFSDIGDGGDPCVAIGLFSSPGGIVGDFTSDVPGGGAFQLVGEEAPGALPMAPQAVNKFAGVPAGTYTIDLAPIDGVSTEPIACDGQFDAGSVVFGDGSITVTVEEDEFVTCDFLAVEHQLRVEVDATPADGTDFGFTGDLGDFALADGESTDVAAPKGEEFSVSTTAPAGWELSGIVCDEGPNRDPNATDDTDVSVDVASGAVTATIADLFARTVTCEFSFAEVTGRAPTSAPAPSPTPTPTPETPAARAVTANPTFTG